MMVVMVIDIEINHSLGIGFLETGINAQGHVIRGQGQKTEFQVHREIKCQVHEVEDLDLGKKGPEVETDQVEDINVSYRNANNNDETLLPVLTKCFIDWLQGLS